MTLPIGAFTNGFQINGFPVERWSTTGAEASVNYVGPSLGRVGFLQNVFGAWGTEDVLLCESQDYSPKLCCAKLLLPPCPYPYPTLIDGEGDCTGKVCMWADTFELTSGGSNSKPYLYDCGVGADPCRRPIMDDCPVSVTVNYRHKSMGKVPDIFTSCYSTPVGIPLVPYGTYFEVRASFTDEGVEFPGRQWNYCIGSTPIPTTWHGSTAQVQQATANPQLPQDIGGFHRITTQRYELIWDYVPLPPWQIFEMAQGKVNAYPFLGFPAEAVRFTMGEPEVRGGFGCKDLYRLRLIFDVKMAEVDCPGFTASIQNPDAQIAATNGYVINNRIGLWNRRISDLPIDMNINGMLCRTAWVPICKRHEQEQPFSQFPFDWLFAMNLCCPDSGTLTVQDPRDQDALMEIECNPAAEAIENYGAVREAWTNGSGELQHVEIPGVSKATAELISNYMLAFYPQHSTLQQTGFTAYGAGVCLP